MGLPGIKQVAEENGKRHSGQNAAGDQLLRQAAQRREACDQQQIWKAAKKESEEAVEITRDEPSRSVALDRLDRARDEGVLASWS